jgi:hypothetical protein
MCECTGPELWAPIPDFNGSYEVSTCGRVRSLDRVVARSDGRVQLRRGLVLRPGIHSHGYQYVILCKSGTQSSRQIHTLVLRVFVGPPADGQEGCHGPNGISDNHPNNLYWGTHSRNMVDRQRDGTDWQRNKLTCPLSHLLAAPNLVACSIAQGIRNCLACSRAQANLQKATKRGLPFDFRAVADAHYKQIMGPK